MAFPTIPTVGAGRVLGNNQANTTATRTFPNLSGLTKNAGDLLIAIVVGYQTGTGTNAAFSGWTAGWTEFHDSATSTTLAIGMAYKWSTGSETGAPTVTQAGTITGHASMMLLSIPTAHASTPPEAGSRASGTGASNPASFDPAGWGAEDTLWIAVGASGMDSASGTWTGMGSAPTNYGSYADTATTDSSTVGQTELAVAFRQLNASAEDVGAFTGNDTSNARDAAVVIAVRAGIATLFGITALPITFTKAVAGIGTTPPKTTPVAEISLASHGTPDTRTSHQIKIRARTTSGSTGVIKAALYEGSTNRSGDLTSDPLTTSLATYTLAIPDASAANITSYGNLSIKFWGYDSAGNALVFEVAEVSLELPASTSSGTTYYGVTSQTTTFGKEVAGSRKTFGVTATPITFGKAVAGSRKTFGVTATPLIFTKAVAGSRKTFGQTVTPITFGKDVAGRRKALGQVAASFTFGKDVAGVVRYNVFGQVAASFTFSKAVSGQRKTFGQTVSPFIFAKDVRGYRKAFGQIALPITFSSTTAGVRVGLTRYGIVALPITFGKDVSGQRKTFSQTALPLTFGKDVSGRRKTFGQVALPIIFIKEAVGREWSYGATSMSTIFGKETAGRRKTFSQSALPIVFTKDVLGYRKTFSSMALPINVQIYVVGVTQGNVYGSTSLITIFGKDVAGQRKTFGQLLSPYLFAATTQGKRRTTSQIILPITFSKAVSGQRKSFSQILMPITFSKDVAGRRKTFSQIVVPLTFSKAVSGQRKTFGQVARPINVSIFVAGYGWTSVQTYYGQLAMPLTFSKQVAAQRKTFGQIVLPLNFVFDVRTGRIKTSGQIAFPIIFESTTNGYILTEAIILNLAESIYLGAEPVVAVYTEGQKVWPPT